MKKIAPTVCWNCNNKKKDVRFSGTFLCVKCQEDDFKRLRQIARGDVELSTTLDHVVRMSNEGQKPKEIATKLGISTASVYNYRSKAGLTSSKKVEITAEEKTSQAPAPDYKSLYLDLQKNFNSEREKHQVEIEELTKQFERETSKLKGGYTQLYTDYMKSLEEYKALEEKLNKLEKEFATPAEDTYYEQAFIIEKQKHEALLNYLSIDNKAKARS